MQSGPQQHQVPIINQGELKQIQSHGWWLQLISRQEDRFAQDVVAPIAKPGLL